MEENNKVEPSEIQVISEDESINEEVKVEKVPTEPIVQEDVPKVEEVNEPNSHSEYLSELIGPNSKITVYALLAVGIVALVVIIFCLFIAFQE